MADETAEKSVNSALWINFSTVDLGEMTPLCEASIPIVTAVFHWMARRDNRINGPPAHPSLFIVLSIQKIVSH